MTEPLWYLPCDEPGCSGHALRDLLPPCGFHSIDCQCDEPCWIPQDDWCGDNLIEQPWEDEGTEGFTCTRIRNHPGDHAAFAYTQELYQGVHKNGRSYSWSHTWRYDDDLITDPHPAGWQQ